MVKPLGSILIVSLFLSLFIAHEALRVCLVFNEDSISMEIEDTEENSNEDPCDDDEIEDTDPKLLLSKLNENTAMVDIDIISYGFINLGLSEKYGLDLINPPESII